MKVLFCVECYPPRAIAVGVPSGSHIVNGDRHTRTRVIEVPDSEMTENERSNLEKYLKRLSKEYASKV